MYRTEPDELQNKKCFSCEFCVWDEERKCEVCNIKGCYQNSKFIKYEVKPHEEINQLISII